MVLSWYIYENSITIVQCTKQYVNTMVNVQKAWYNHGKIMHGKNGCMHNSMHKKQGLFKKHSLHRVIYKKLNTKKILGNLYENMVIPWYCNFSFNSNKIAFYVYILLQ